MAALITHLLVGERVFAQLPRFDPAVYGEFLLGCALVDVHVFSDIERPATHFARRLDGDGPFAFNKSCANFLDQLDDLLVRPWNELTPAEQAFVAGYLCHLAADEDWKRFDWYLLHTLGIYWWLGQLPPPLPGVKLMPAPGDVVLTVFEVLSSKLYADFPAIVSALNAVSVPNVLTHVSHSTFQTTWDICKMHALGSGTLESYIEILKRLGKNDAEIQTVRLEHERYWQEAMRTIHNYFGGVQQRVQDMVQHSLKKMPLLQQLDQEFYDTHRNRPTTQESRSRGPRQQKERFAGMGQV